MARKARTLNAAQQQDRKDQRAAARNAAIATGNLAAYRMVGRTMPNKRREADRRACRGRVVD